MVDKLKVKLIEKQDPDVNKDASFYWKKCLSLIKEQVKPITYNTWFSPIVPLQIENKTLIVQVPTQFFWEWIEEHYHSILIKSVQNVLGTDAKISFVVKEEVENEKSPIHFVEIKNNGTNGKKENLPPIESNLNPRYQFSNFIQGEGNQLARATGLAISENPGETSFNPFFVYGGVGLGKTHLIQAIGNRIKEKFPDKRVLYISSDDFTRKFVDAIQNNQANEFQNFYRTLDVLIIDDIQFLSGKEKTQDLFFHIFNNLHQSRKQIILSSDKPPKELKGLDDRLISRFKWGLQADIQPPDFETRVAILNSKAQEFGMNLSPQLIEFISTNITSNIRELEGCLIKMLATATISSKEIDMELTKKIVKEIASDKKISLGIDDITKIVCEFLSLPENKIREKTRKKEIVFARQIAMYLSKEYTSNSLKTIGLYFGGKDHSTVIHAYNQITKNLESDIHLQEIIEKLRSKIEMVI
ncbi:MAG: chromosomal replication initiator protein DnaA [Ignavibacterium sp.]|nr:chromosomal replication initiator protein DnaA [Ignavibacterium sp.]MCX7611868.1 chromosomal replication initiator protein DnaA [Ignavibacterium sp.]MDW8374898.1 chromosomal replication initiator protein DnaA [Ignavibacteriales bacterium]